MKDGDSSIIFQVDERRGFCQEEGPRKGTQPKTVNVWSGSIGRRE